MSILKRLVYFEVIMGLGMRRGWIHIFVEVRNVFQRSILTCMVLNSRCGNIPKVNENMNRLLFCIKRRMSMTERMKEEDQDKDGRALGE